MLSCGETGCPGLVGLEHKICTPQWARPRGKSLTSLPQICDPSPSQTPSSLPLSCLLTSMALKCHLEYQLMVFGSLAQVQEAAIYWPMAGRYPMPFLYGVLTASSEVDFLCCHHYSRASLSTSPTPRALTVTSESVPLVWPFSSKGISIRVS